MYEMKNEVPFTRTGSNGLLKLHEAVGMMMDCCQFQEYQEKEFCKFLRENEIAIFLFSMQLDVFRYPAFREPVTTAVKIYGCKSIYGLRRITMRDAAGRLCMISNATGAFFDLKAGRALKLDTATLPLRFDPAESMECLPRKIPVPAEQGCACEPMRVTNSLLDPNGHLTSSIYFAAAADALTPELRFNRVRVEFKRQTKPGSLLCPVRFPETGGKTVVDLRDEEGNSHATAEFSDAVLTPEAQ